MKEKRLLYFALGILSVVGIGQATSIRNDGLQFPDGSVQTTAAATRSFFLTKDPFSGSMASSAAACGAGYHMASIWEIFDVSNLRYASELPNAAAGEDGPIPALIAGWIRTGGSLSTANTIGEGNCNGYTVEGSGLFGTVAFLGAFDWNTYPASGLGPWQAGSLSCVNEFRVWCVGD